MKGPYFTISNLLSISRLILVWPIAHLLQQDNPRLNYLVLFLIFIACLTDFLDGYLARKMNQISDFGKLLDPLADKVATLITIALLIHYRNFPVWLFAIILARDVCIVFGAFFIINKQKIMVQSNWPGKITIGILAGLVIVYILNLKGLIPFFIGLTLAGIIISGLSYLKRLFPVKDVSKTTSVQAHKMS